MCFNISNTRKMIEIEARFSAVMEEDKAEWNPSPAVSGFTRPQWPVLCSDQPDKLKWGCWGLVPPWVQRQEQADDLSLKTLNARAESLLEKPSFRDSVSRRCLVPVTGFFEPHHRRGVVYPYLFSRPGEELFALAGIFSDNPLYSTQRDRSFSIVTVPADQDIARIHNKKKRMPLILLSGQWADWLENPYNDRLWQDLARIPHGLQHWPVSRELYKRNRSLEGQDLLKKVPLPEEKDSGQLGLEI